MLLAMQRKDERETTMFRAGKSTGGRLVTVPAVIVRLAVPVSSELGRGFAELYGGPSGSKRER